MPYLVMVMHEPMVQCLLFSIRALQKTSWEAIPIPSHHLGQFLRALLDNEPAPAAWLLLQFFPAHLHSAERI